MVNPKYKLYIISDLHLEFIKNKKDYPDYFIDRNGILIIVGDVCPFNTHKDVFIEYFTRRSKDFKDILFVAGNHEYYHGDIVEVNRELEAFFKSIKNIHFLNNKKIQLNNINFIGSTLWTDLNNVDPITLIDIESNINDFHLIKYDGERFNTDHWNKLHQDGIKFIKKSLSKTKPNVIITHHSPLFQTIEEQYKESPYIRSFYNNFDELIYNNTIDSWIFGHTHQFFNEIIHDTRIISNAYGYNGYDIINKVQGEFVLTVEG